VRRRAIADARSCVFELLAHRVVSDCSLPLAAMFAENPRRPSLGHNATGPAVAGPVALINAATSSALVPQKSVETWGVAGTTSAEAWSIFSLWLVDSTALALLTSGPI
jgi:hypothetical protein